MNKIIEEMSDSEVLDFTIINQQRGWFNSTYDIAIEPAGEMLDRYREYKIRANQQRHQQSNQQNNIENEGQIFNIVTRNVIHHGPFPIGGFDKGTFSLVPVIATIDTEVVSVSGIENTEDISEFPTSYSIHSLVSLTGEITSVVNIDTWSGIPEGGKAQIDWQGLNAEFSYNATGGDLKGTISMPSFSISQPDEKFLLSDFLIEIDTKEHSQSLALGEVSFHIGAVNFDNLKDASQNFSMGESVITIASHLSDGNISSTMEMHITSIQAGKRHFGPGGYVLKLSNLDAESIRKIGQQLKELKKQGVPQEQMGLLMVANMFSILPDLLAKGPKLEISKLRLESDYGLLEGNGQVYFDTSNKAALLNPMLLKEAIIAELEFSIPEELVILLATKKAEQEIAESEIENRYSEEQIKTMARTQIKNQLNLLVEKNVFVRNNEYYNISASFKKGLLTVNGDVVKFPQVQQPSQIQ